MIELDPLTAAHHNPQHHAKQDGSSYQQQQQQADKVYVERQQPLYNERNIDLAIRFSQQTAGNSPQDTNYPLSRTGTDDSLTGHEADFHEGMVVDGRSESSASSGTWPSPNHILKVKK